MSDPDPLGIFLASSGSKGDRVLFWYPFETEESRKTCFKPVVNNPYAVRIEEDLHASRSILSNIAETEKCGLSWYSDRVLANLLAVKGGLCNNKFEVKINDVLFVGHPLSLQNTANTGGGCKREAPTIISFNVVFALQAGCDSERYEKLAHQIGVALRHEERRCGYLSNEQHVMWSIQDEVAARTEDARESPYREMLDRSSLANSLKQIYDSICNSGVVQVYINKWSHISFCLPHKLHNLHIAPDSGVAIKPEAIYRCLEMMRPYHGVLILVEECDLIACLPLDSSPALLSLLRVVTPLKNMQNLASDADLPLGQVYRLVSHLVYWNKAIIIFPLAETNVYVLAPNTNTSVHSTLVAEFVDQFPGMSLPAIMGDFSLPIQLGEHRDILGLPQQQAQQVQMVVFLLKHRLLIQLHTYVHLLPSARPPPRSRAAKYLQLPSVEEMPASSHSAGQDGEAGSVTSEESPSVSAFSIQTPSVEIASDGMVITEDTREQWRSQDTLLAGLSNAVKQSVMNVPAAANPEDLKLFARLCPYFNGQHHLEEIMFYENVRRSQLLTLLDKFRDVLITCQHEDPSTTCWLHQTAS